MFNQMLKAFEREFIGQSKEWYPVNDSIYCGRITDEQLEDMQSRNDAAIKQCIKDMGNKWVLHSSHKVTRL